MIRNDILMGFVAIIFVINVWLNKSVVDKLSDELHTSVLGIKIELSQAKGRIEALEKGDERSKTVR